MRIEPLPHFTEPSIGDGGFAKAVFPDPINSNFVVKVFKTPVRSEGAKRLVALADANVRMRTSTWYMLQTRMAWCVGFYGSNLGDIEGVRLPRAKQHFYYFSSQRGEELCERELSLDILLFSNWFTRPHFTEVPFTEVPYIDRVEIAFEFVTIFQFLWSTGFYFSDFSARNILWSPSPHLEVFVIDADSVVTADEEGVHSPDWIPPAGLGVPEADRALVGLAIWRILALEPFSYPGQTPTGHLLDLTSQELESLMEAWTEGSARSIGRIRSWLSERRDSTIASEKFRRASDSGFARVVLAYAPSHPTPEETEIIERAAFQRNLERELEVMAPFARQTRLRTMVSQPGFDFDLVPEGENFENPSDDWSVIEMVLDGKYDDVADGVHQGLLGSNPSAIVKRAVEMKLFDFGAPNIRIQTQSLDGSSIRMEWSWPGWFGVSLVIGEVIDHQGKVLHTKVVPRHAGGILTIDKTVLPNKELRVRMRFACQIPEGSHIMSSEATLVDIGFGLQKDQVSPIPIAVSEHVTRSTDTVDHRPNITEDTSIRPDIITPMNVQPTPKESIGSNGVDRATISWAESAREPIVDRPPPPRPEIKAVSDPGMKIHDGSLERTGSNRRSRTSLLQRILGFFRRKK